MCFSFPVPRTNPRLVPHVTFVMESWLLFLSPRLPRKDSLAISSRICLFRMAMILVFERMTKMSHFILASSLRPLQILLLTSFVLTASLLAWRASSGSFYWFSSLVLVLFLEFHVGKSSFFWIVKCNLDITRFGFISVVLSSADLALRGGYCHGPETLVCLYPVAPQFSPLAINATLSSTSSFSSSRPVQEARRCFPKPSPSPSPSVTSY